MKFVIYIKSENDSFTPVRVVEISSTGRLNMVFEPQLVIPGFV